MFHKNLLLFFLLAAVLACSSWAADPLSGGTGARPLALGNAYVALSDDGSAIFVNPAGLAGIKHLTFTSMYTQPASETTFTSLGAARPDFLGGVIGAGYRNRTSSNVSASAETVNVTNQDLALLFAKEVRENFLLGAELRFISRGMSKDVPGFEGFNAGGSAFGLGLKYSPRPWVGIGVLAKNLGGRMTAKTVATEIPVNTSLGASFNFGNRILNIDLSKSAEEPLVQLHLGLEWWLKELLALRLGIDQSPKTSAENYNNVTAGLGLRYRGVTFDYALYQQEAPPQSITHYFSWGYVGSQEIKPSPPPLPSLLPTPEAKALRKVERVRFKDVPEKHWAKEEIELLATAGLISGFPDGTFRPDLKLTVGEFEALLAQAKHLLSAPVSKSSKLMKRQEAVKILELSLEVSRPQDPLTRAEFAVFLSQTPFARAAIKRLPPHE